MIVVSDASVLINLDRIGQLQLLPAIYGSVLVPVAVWRELLRGSPTVAGARPTWLTVGVVKDFRMVGKPEVIIQAPVQYFTAHKFHARSYLTFQFWEEEIVVRQV